MQTSLGSGDGVRLGQERGVSDGLQKVRVLNNLKREAQSDRPQQPAIASARSGRFYSR
jgi:hypothetical protein